MPSAPPPALPANGAVAEARAEAVARARRAWPNLDVADGAFAAHLARHATPHAGAAAIAELHIEDLFLACACALGDANALAAIDKTVFEPAIAYARRVHRASDGLVDEAAQQLRVRLFVREPAREPAIATYHGRSPLQAWMRVSAIREARSLLRKVHAGARGGPESPVEDVDRGPTAIERVGSPELALLKREGAAAMRAAIERVLRALDERDRALLRLYFVEGMPLATLGRIYHVHESTMARRVQELRGRLLDEVQRDLAVGMTTIYNLRALVESQIDVHLSAVLRRAP